MPNVLSPLRNPLIDMPSAPTDATPDAPLPTLAELKRRARKVRSRHPLAKGGRGSRKRAAGKSTIDSLVSKNSAQKGLSDLSDPSGTTLATVDAAGHAVPVPSPRPVLVADDPAAPIAPMSDEEQWAKAGDINVLVYARPVNPRLLLITLDDGTHGRCLMHPVDRQRFSVGKRIWVRHERKDIYRLTGRYNRWGSRCG